jgi:DNA-directed RNA polymerase subunit F
MSTKGLPVSQATRQKISLAKTKYTVDYLTSCATKYLQQFEKVDPEHPKLPTVAGFCRDHHIEQSRLYRIANDKPEVRKLLDQILQLQEAQLLDDATYNRANAGFAQFLLKSKHGYTSEPVTLTQNNNFTISPDIVKTALTIMANKKAAK